MVTLWPTARDTEPCHLFTEMLPIFLAVIQEHPDAPARRSLSKALFNLIKKPDRAQRKASNGPSAVDALSCSGSAALFQ